MFFYYFNTNRKQVLFFFSSSPDYKFWKSSFSSYWQTGHNETLRNQFQRESAACWQSGHIAPLFNLKGICSILAVWPYCYTSLTYFKGSMQHRSMLAVWPQSCTNYLLTWAFSLLCFKIFQENLWCVGNMAFIPILGGHLLCGMKAMLRGRLKCYTVKSQ